MTVRVYQYPKCSTCRKALTWLRTRGVAFEAIDVVATPPSPEVLADLLSRSGVPLARLFNTSGESYRAGNFKDRLKTMTTSQALQALAADGKLIKRPLLDDGNKVVVGFDAASYEATFPAASRNSD